MADSGWDVLEHEPLAKRKNAVRVRLDSKRGSLTNAGFDILGQPEAVEILFRPKERLLGLRRTAPDAPNAYLVSKGSGTDVSHRFSIQGLIKRYNIDVSEPRRYDGELRDGILVFDLNNPVEVPDRRAQPRRKGTDDAGA